MTGSKIKVAGLLLSFFIVASVQVHAVTFTVRQDGQGNFKSIQAAIDAAGMADEIVIMDAAVYDEQVTIDSTKGGLILRSEVPTAVNKPTIRFKDIENVHPINFAESQDTATINYTRNGALRILGAAGVRIEGLIIDGGGPFPFAYPAVWEGITPLFHGNAALVLDVTGEMIIRNCDIRNAYFGIYCHDRNEGGIFAKANPGDLYPENVIPLSGFARTGNHLFEYNRIHDNSWGIYFESVWDMGSTVRYNMIYNNHHASDNLATQVASLPGGNDQAGGAFLFKDDLFAPVSIHNNTFYHNFLLFAGLTRAGAQHLIFNNIYGAPFRLWSSDPYFPNPSVAIDQRFVNRMYNSVYAGQAEEPEMISIRLCDSVRDAAANRYVVYDTTVSAISRLRIMNGMEQIKKGMVVFITVHLSAKDTVVQQSISDVIQPGNSITAMTNLKPFPEPSNVRWAVIPFLSTDPLSPDFLTPDWNDPLVNRYVVDQGWGASGVKDPDGSPADLGAVPMGGGRPVDVVTVRPVAPVSRLGPTLTISLNITPRIGTMTEPKFAFIRYVKDIDTADQKQFIPEQSLYTVPCPAQPPLEVGTNQYDINLPDPLHSVSFFELIIEGKGTDGKKFTSSTGFLPYRSLEYMLEVRVLDAATKEPIQEIRAGAPCILRISAYKNGGQLFTNTIDPTDVKLQSRFDLLTSEGAEITSIPDGVTGSTDLEVVFTRIPIDGMEYVIVSGKWVNGTKIVAFLGSSDAIKILPGPADSIQFQDPISHMDAKFNAGTTYLVKVQAFDKFGNKVDSGSIINCISTKSDVGDIAAKEVRTDSTGMATFHAQVTNGGLNDTFMIVASLASKPSACDIAYMIIGNVSAVIMHSIIPVKPRELLCELIDLRGRVVKRTMVYRQLPLIGKNPFSGTVGRGMYLVRMTDQVTGKVTTGQRLLLNK